MKKILTGVALTSILLYVLSSFAFPAWGERIVVPIMILCLAAACISLIALLTIYTKERMKK